MGTAHEAGATAAVPSARRRYLTLLFADLSESTALADLMEAERYGEMLGELRRIFREVIPRHGGMLVRAQGDGILAMFGYPDAREDDGRRATEAALELHEAVRGLRVAGKLPGGRTLSLHSGVHAGLVLVADGDMELGRFELLGSVPNIAARLSDQAGADELFVSEETLGPQARYFETSECRALALRGRAQPLRAYAVRRRAAPQALPAVRSMRGLAPFVGRHAEMLALERHLHAAAAAVPQFVAVAGGPGLGKTRLIEQLLQLAGAAGWTVCRGYCENYLGALPLQPFVQMLRAHFGIVHETPAPRAALAVETGLQALGPAASAYREALLHALSLALPGPAAPPGSPQVVAALCKVFDTLAARRPLLLFIDDWQWADDASHQVLEAIRTLPCPIFVLVSTRDAAAARGAEILPLEPLNAEESARTIECLLVSPAPFLAEEIHRYAGGNPLFIEELCHSAAVDGAGTRVGRVHAGAAWLDTLIESRVARLPPAQAQVVKVAAVLGNVFPAWLLERISGHAADDPVLHALAEHDFIFPGGQAGTLRFKHGITRDVIYDAVGFDERRAMHLRVAAALAEGDASTVDDAHESLAYHYGAGGQPADAALHAELAGDKAMRASALDRARTQYRAALTALDALGVDRPERRQRWIAIVQRLGLASVFDPLGLEDGVALFERGVELAHIDGDAATLARAEYWLCYICYAKGLAREAVLHGERALARAEHVGDARLVAQVRAALGQALATAGGYDRALLLLDVAIDAKRRNVPRSGSVAVGSAYALACKGSILGDRGAFALAHECLAEALQLASEGTHHVRCSVLGWICTVYQWQGRWQEALAAGQEATRIAAHVKSSHMFAISQALAGYADWMLTRRPQALAAIQDAAAWTEARGGRLFTSLIYGWLVDALVAQGNTAAARHRGAQAIVRGREGERIGEAMARRALALAALQADDRPAVERHLRAADRSAALRGSAHEAAVTTLLRARIAAERGLRHDARAALDGAEEAFTRLDMQWHLAEAQALRRGL